MKLNLKARYGLSIIGVVMAVAVLLAGTLLFQFRNSLRDTITSTEKVVGVDLTTQFKHRGAMLTEFLSNDLVIPVYRLDMKEIYSTLTLARRQHGVKYAMVYDATGRILHDGENPYPPNDKKLEDNFGMEALKGDGLQIRSLKGGMEFARPIMMGNQVLGGIQVGLDLSTIDSDLDNMKTQISLIGRDTIRGNVIAIGALTVLLCLLGLGMAYWLSGNLTQPILNLQEMTREVAKGNFNINPLKDRHDEIGDLAKDFRTMAEDLKKTTVSKTYVESIISQMVDTLMVVSLEGVIERANKSACDLLGYKDSDLEGRAFETLVANEQFRKNWMPNLRAKKPFIAEELEYITRTGNKIPVQFSAGFIHEANGTINSVVCVARDITLLKKNQKFTVIGQLAATVAHELRNPLGTIQNAIYYMKDFFNGSPALQEDPNLVEFMDIATVEIKRSNVIIADLLDYSREVKLKPEPTELCSLYKDSLTSVAMPENIQVSVTDVSNIPSVNVDPIKMHQVVVNLLTNAVQAMPKGGTLHILSSVERESNNLIWYRTDFKDTGVGMSPDNLKHLFDPLFTTKIKGTGLGLAICQEIIKAHGGKIEVQSKLNQGTVVTVRIPVTSAQMKAA